MPTAAAIEVLPRHAENCRDRQRAAALALMAAVVLLAGCGGGKPAAPPPPPPAPPTVTSINPNHGALGSLVTIAGQRFGSDPAAIQVTFKAPAQGAMVVPPLLDTAGNLQVLVPGALAEQAQVTVTVAGQASTPAAFIIDALTDPTPGGTAETQAFFFGDVDGILGRLLPILDSTVVPLLEEAGQPTEAASMRSGLTTLRGAFASAVAATLASKTPEQLAVLDAFFASPAAAAVKQELAALLLELPAPPQARLMGAGLSRRDPLAASAGTGIMQGFDSGTVDSIEAARRFLIRARVALNRLDNVLLVAIGACTAGTVLVGPEAAALAGVLLEIRESLVKPLLRILDTVIDLIGICPTRVAGGTLRIQVTDHLLYNDQEFGSMEAPFPAGDSGVVLVTEPYGVRGFVTFKNDGGASLRSTGADLVPSLGLVLDALMKLTGVEIGALEVTDAPTRLQLISSDPAVIEGTWSDPSLWITALKPGLVDVTLRVGLEQVQESCPLGFVGPTCIPASEVQVTRTMRAMAGTQVNGPYTQGPRLFSAQVTGQPPATAFLGEVLDVTGEGFSTNPQLAPQDVMFEPAPGYPLSGVAGSPSESLNRYESFKVVVPDALPGPMTVVLNGSPSNPIPFTILPPLLDPPVPSAIVGEYQRVTGKGFSQYASHNQGDWNGFRLRAEGGTHDWLDFTIPAGATSGPFKVVTLGQLVSNEHPVVVRRFSEPALLSGGGRLGLRPVVAHDRQSAGAALAQGFKLGHPAHVVNIAMAIKHPGVFYQQSQEPRLVEAVFKGIQSLDEHHGQVGGRFAGDEHLSGRRPTQGTELCGVVEYMYSLEKLIGVLGDAALADRLEALAYNAYPSSFTPDFWAHQYDQQANQVLCTRAKRGWSSNGNDSNLYGLEPNYGCCTANLHQGWPKFVSHLWMATHDAGLVAVAYGPSQVKARIGDGPELTITETTQYPFDGLIRFKLAIAEPTPFPLYFRIPGWAARAQLKVNGKPVAVQAGTFARLEHNWKNGDVVVLSLPMDLRTETRYHNAVSILRGPLAFSLKISEQFKQLKSYHPTLPAADWEVTPASPWNYALNLDPARPDRAIRVHTRDVGPIPFAQSQAPVVLQVKGRPVPEWGLVNNSAGETPASPVLSTEPEVALELIPYGSTRLRITEFPVLAAPAKK